MRTKEGSQKILEYIASCKEIIKKHMSTFDVLKVADIEMLEDLDDMKV